MRGCFQGRGTLAQARELVANAECQCEVEDRRGSQKP
jgi:hypothetical protein